MLLSGRFPEDMACLIQENSSMWSRPLRVWELEELDKLKVIINSIKLVHVDDTLVWTTSLKPYSTKQAVDSLFPTRT